MNMHEFKIVLDNLSAKICKMTELIMHYNGNLDVDKILE